MRWFGLGPGEIILVCMIALLLFGNRIPEVMRTLGDSHSSSRRLQRHQRYEAERQTEDFAKRMTWFGQAVVFMVSAASVAVVIVYLLRAFGLL